MFFCLPFCSVSGPASNSLGCWSMATIIKNQKKNQKHLGIAISTSLIWTNKFYTHIGSLSQKSSIIYTLNIVEEWLFQFFFLNGVGIRSRKRNSRHITRYLSRKFLEGLLKKVSRGWGPQREREVSNPSSFV